jgi:hypothetical protein
LLAALLDRSSTHSGFRIVRANSQIRPVEHHAEAALSDRIRSIRYAHTSVPAAGSERNRLTHSICALLAENLSQAITTSLYSIGKYFID